MLKDILSQFPDWEILDDNEHIDFELRLNVLPDRSQELTDDVYFTLMSKHNMSELLNIRVRKDELIEVYPTAAKDDWKAFIHEEVEGRAPYFSIDMKSKQATDIYWLPKGYNFKRIRKLNLINGKIRTYLVKEKDDKFTFEEKEIFDKWEPFRVYYYYDDGKLTGVLLTYLYGISENYEKMKTLANQRVSF